MPRPPRRVASSRTTAVATEAKTTQTTTTTTQRRTRSSDVGREQSTSSDAYGVSDRELKRRGSLRHAVAKTSARQAGTKATAAETEDADVNAGTTASQRGQKRNASQTRALRGAAHAARGPDVSGIDMLDDETFGDIDTSFGGGLEGLSGLDSSPPAPGDATAAAAETAGTHSTDASSLFNVGLFRRGRPRQSSIHSRDDAPIRPSSREGATAPMSSTFNLGSFRRRRREPSILGRRAPSSSRAHSRDRDGGETSGSEHPYTSDAEPPSAAAGRSHRRRSSRVAPAGVPSHHSSSLSVGTANSTSFTSMLMARTRSTRTASGKKRKSEEADHNEPVTASAATRASKRRSTEAAPEEPEEEEAAPLPSSDPVLPSVEGDDDQHHLSSPALSSPPSLVMSEVDRRRYITPGGPNDEIMAPPESSDSEADSPPVWPTLKSLANASRRGGRSAAAAPAPLTSRETPELVDDDDSDISSPPSLTHSPNYSRAPSPGAAAKTANKAGKAQKNQKTQKNQKDAAPLTTAALAALLPQRRGRAVRDDDLGEDDTLANSDDIERSALLSEDDDELAHRPAGRAGPRRGRSASARRGPLSVVASVNKTVPASKSSSKNKTKPRRRVYGSRSFSDAENQDDEPTGAADDSTFSPLPDDAFADETTMLEEHPSRARRFFGEEIVKASKKFKEVDEWEMSFENVSRSSSPVGAR